MPLCFQCSRLTSILSVTVTGLVAVDRSFSRSRSALVMASTDPHQFALASSMSAKSAYLYLLSVNFVPPHCEEKFLPLYGSLY